MIETGLPYKIDEMESIRQNGAIVDLSKLEFLGIPENRKIKTALIYLRNTGFNVTLKYDNMSKEDKFELLKIYLTQDIENKDVILAESWSKILNYTTGLITEARCILTNEEIEEFIQENLEMLGGVLRLLISLPVYLIKRYKLDDENTSLDMSDFEEIKEKPIGINLSHIIEVEGIALLYTHDYEFPPAYYSEIFTMDNNQLFETLMNTTFGIIFLGLTSSSEEEVKKLFESMDAFEKEYNDGIL